MVFSVSLQLYWFQYIANYVAVLSSRSTVAVRWTKVSFTHAAQSTHNALTPTDWKQRMMVTLDMYKLCTIIAVLCVGGVLIGLLHVTSELFNTTSPSPTFADDRAAQEDLDGERDSRGLP
jgi:hypothetical protein